MLCKCCNREYWDVDAKGLCRSCSEGGCSPKQSKLDKAIEKAVVNAYSGLEEEISNGEDSDYLKDIAIDLNRIAVALERIANLMEEK